MKSHLTCTLLAVACLLCLERALAAEPHFALRDLGPGQPMGLNNAGQAIISDQTVSPGKPYLFANEETTLIANGPPPYPQSWVSRK